MAPRFTKVKVRTRLDRQGRRWFSAFWYVCQDGERHQRAQLLGPIDGKNRITTVQAESLVREIEKGLNAQPVQADPSPVVQQTDATVMPQPVGPVLQTGKVLTLKDRWQNWKQELEDSKSQAPGTIRDKDLAFEKHIFPALGGRPITAITRDDLQVVFNKMISEASGITNVYKVRNYLSGLFTHLLKFEKVAGLESNPCRFVQLPAKSTPIKPKLPPEGTLDKVATILPTKSSILFDSIRTFGARPGEVTALKWYHIDFINNTIDIDQHVRGGDLLRGTKNQVCRRVDMTPSLARSLKAWKEISKPKSDDDWVFPARTRNGSDKPVRYNNLLRRDLKKACDHLGVKGLNWKLLRHCFATAAVKQGVDPITLQSIMGHRSITTTLKYYAHVDEEVRKAWTLELSKRMYSGASEKVKTGGCKGCRPGRLTKIDATVMPQLMPQRSVRKGGIG